ncbi:serine/threonine-protein kinase 31 isoform X4 [Salmo trutta]|uniref:serine/threonine-protein kinase 31 isoform X4 n=1 Tax=Salmo trutta TaxID=8032 RepID=UPI0011304AF2|nr:serine/threonine-protein kinase 31-like isoform X4 [Salmo trutta]
MDGEDMELVGVTHVLDAVTFWAQNVNDDQAIENIRNALADKCPTAQRLLGTPNPQKIYGAVFSEDSCWYRCKVLQQTDNFHVSYIDYGNTEFVSRSALVELPGELQSPCLAKKYKFWGFNVSTDQNSAHFLQGKAFLQNLIYGKKVRIQKKSVCFDGTVLVQAFQGNLDIGEEVLKMKFAKFTLPGSNRESPVSVRALQESHCLWSQRVLDWPGPQGDGDMPGSTVCMPKLRTAFPDQSPLSMKEKSTATAQHAANLVKKKMELVEENQRLKAERETQRREDQLRDSLSELQKLKEETANYAKEAERWKVERNTLQNQSEQLEKHLKVAKQEVQAMRGQLKKKEKQVDKLLDSAVAERFCRLAERVDSLRGLRERNPGNTDSDSLTESINVVINNSISAPVAMEKLESAWRDYSLAQEKLKACQTKEQLGDLIDNRNKVRGVLAATVESFLQETKCLPVRQRMDKLKEVSSSLTAVFGPASMEGDVGEQAFEQYYQWRTQRSRLTSSVRDGTDKALKALCTWSENVGKEQNNHETKVVSNAFHKVMQHIQSEQSLLSDIMEKYLLNTKFKGEMLQWQNASPTPDSLFSVKKRIRSLRAQLRWRQVEEASLEEAEDFDLTEILKKKEEIAETRNTLFQEIGQERKEYMKLSALAEGCCPELPLLYPEADIHSHMSSGGLVVKSLDRNMFDAEPMKELSGRRPLVCTEFQGQRVILKGYTVNEEAEARVLERTTQFHRTRTQRESQTDTGILPLLALFFGKSDPLAYVMVPYFPNGSLWAVQAAKPLTATETVKVMRGVARGLRALHAAGVTHASLNPNNIFVLHRHQGMVGDYDFIKTPVQRAMDSGMVAGSISLVAPELCQTQGTPPTPACDMYSYGCLLFWLHAPGFNGDLDSGRLALDISGVKLEARLQALLSKLLVCVGRLTAAETLADDYFLSDQ